MKGKILIAEDETFIAELYHQKFLQENLEVVMAEDGEIAWEKIQNEDISIVLLDISMPKMTGLEVLKKIRNDEEKKELPVIVLSNNDGRNDMVTAMDLGANDYLVKVCNTPDDVVVATKKMIEKLGL